ncbi:MAG: hypothetical protein H6Q05_5 [Acidobacteria bacterium]|nr:hypothetical protein [Acidobacteriota bacterium]
MRRHTILLLAGVLILVLIAAVSVSYLRSDKFRERVRSSIVAQIEQSTGLRAGMSRFSIDILRGRFSLSDFELKSRKETGNRFELRIAEISGSFRLAALWSPRIELAELDMERLRMEILQEPGGGTWSLGPVIQKSLAVAARKAVVRDGWVHLNNRRIPLDLQVIDLQCGIEYRPAPQSYAIRLSYRSSPLEWADRKFLYDLDAALRMSPGGLDIESFDLREGKSRFTGSGSLSDWSAPALRLHATGRFSSDDLTLITPHLREARGDVDVTSDILWDRRGFHAEGSFVAEAAGYRQASAQDLRGLFEVKEGALQLREVRGRMGPGSFRVQGVLELSGARSRPHHLEISGENIIVRDGSGVLGLDAMQLENSVDAEATLEWRRGLQDLQADGTVFLHGLTAGAAGPGVGTPLEGTAAFAYRQRAWILNTASLSSPGTKIGAQGLDAERARIQLDTSQPVEVLEFARTLSSSLDRLIQENPGILGISGRIHLNGEMRLRPENAMAYDGQVNVAEGRWKNIRVDSLSALAAWRGKRLQLRALRLRQGTQSAEGELDFTMPQDSLPAGFQFAGTIRQISLASLSDFGVDLKAQVAGLLSGQGRIEFQHGAFQGEGQFQVENGSYNEEKVDLVRAAVRVGGRELHIQSGLIQRGSAAVNVQGRVNLDTHEMDLSAGLKELQLQDLARIRAGGLAIDGRLTAAGTVRGTLERPDIKAGVDLEGLRYAEWDLGRGKASVEWEDQSLSATFDVQSDLGGFRGEARLSTETGFPGRVTLVYRDWNVKRIIADIAPAIFNDLTTALHGTLVIEGPFADTSRLTLRGEMDGARFKVQDYEFRNEGLIRFAAREGRVNVEEARLTGEGSNLTLDGAIPYGAGASLDLRLAGILNLGFLDRLSPKIGVSGRASLDVRASGSLSGPEVFGKASLEDTRVAYQDLPYPVSSLRGNLVFNRNSIKLEEVAGSMSSGAVQLTGTLEHQNGELRALNLQANLQRVRLHYPKNFVSTVDAQLSLRGNRDSQVLAGDVTVQRAEYLRDFSLLEQILGRDTGASMPQVANPLLAGLRLNLSIRSANGLYIDNELARVQGGMSLELSGSPAYPSLTGRVLANEGTLFFRGTRFDIIQGSADFVDKNRINPVLDVRAEADVRSYRLRLDAGGDLAHLRLNLTSDPPLSTVDIVSLLTTGMSGDLSTAGSESQRRQAEMMGESAASILSESLTGVIGKRVERIFGLQSFRVDPFLAGTENDPTARVTISERLPQNLTVTYSRNLSTTTEQIVIIEYDVTKNLTIVATQDEFGAYGVDFRFRKRLR